jgi:hypothetical protein
MKSKTPLQQRVALARRRFKRHYLAMVRAERANDWRKADAHYATLANAERYEQTIVDLAQLSIHR